MKKACGNFAYSLLFATLVASSGFASDDSATTAIIPSNDRHYQSFVTTAHSGQYQYTQDRRQLQDEDETIVIFFHGTVLNDLWEPIGGAQVQFWQTDKHGVYNHPQDLSSRGNPQLIPDFQYFGTSTADEAGNFDFITYRPGIYSSRPITHIHYKAFVDGVEVLTSQFYFADESSSSQFSSSTVLELEPIVPTQNTDDATAAEYFRTQGNAPSSSTVYYFQTSKTIIVDMNLGGTTETTPDQTAGPFYPVVDFFDMGNDLTRPATPTTIAPTDNSASSSSSRSTNVLVVRTSNALLPLAVLISFSAAAILCFA